MVRRCEVCASMSDTPARPAGKVRRILVDTRIVSLCEHHARLVTDAGVDTIPELRALFTEPNGKRSRLPRRAPLDRRVFPPRPEGRRRNNGRRATDPKDLA